MSFFFLVSLADAPPMPGPPLYDSRQFWLESWDGSLTVPIAMTGYEGVVAQRGLLGLEVAPTEVLTDPTPGGRGTRVVGVLQRERPVALPFVVLGSDQRDLWDRMAVLREITNPTRGMTEVGNFRLVCASSSGTRHLDLAYRSGLEGADSEYGDAAGGVDRVVLDCVAPLPFAQDRVEQHREFQLVTETDPFLGGVWGDIFLVSSTVVGEATPVALASEVPVWPTIEVTGPATSVLITADNGLRIDVPGGVPGGSMLQVVTNGDLGKSIRLDGDPAAGMLARGSRFAPFDRGTTLVTVAAPGATVATSLTLRWRGMHRSMW